MTHPSMTRMSLLLLQVDCYLQSPSAEKLKLETPMPALLYLRCSFSLRRYIRTNRLMHARRMPVCVEYARLFIQFFYLSSKRKTSDCRPHQRQLLYNYRKDFFKMFRIRSLGRTTERRYSVKVEAHFLHQ